MKRYSRITEDSYGMEIFDINADYKRDVNISGKLRQIKVKNLNGNIVLNAELSEKEIVDDNCLNQLLMNHGLVDDGGEYIRDNKGNINVKLNGKLIYVICNATSE